MESTSYFTILKKREKYYINKMTESYWQKKAKERSILRDQAALPSRRDIVIIGGGLIGVAVAYYLKKLGCDNVLVLEKEFIGYGASGRNAGFLLAGLSEPYSRLVVGMGHESAKFLYQKTLDNHDLISSAIQDSSIPCEYKKSGSFHLAVSEVEKNEYRDSVDLLVRDGFKAEFFDKLPENTGKYLAGFSGGFKNPSDGQIDPFAFVNGLSQELDIIENTEVLSIHKKGVDVVLESSRGKIQAEMVVIATNGYAPLIDKYFEKLIFPIRGQVMATKPLIKNILGEEIFYTNFGYDYFRQSNDNSVLMGGLRNRYFKDETGCEDIINTSLQDDLIKYISEILGVPQFDIYAKWSGVMGNTIDGLPLVGALPHNSSVLAAVGFNGHGFGLGMIVAHDLAKAIMTGEKSELLDRFSMRRFF